MAWRALSFSARPFFLEGHRAEISQHRVQPPVIVKRKPTDHLVLCPTSREISMPPNAFFVPMSIKRWKPCTANKTQTLQIPQDWRELLPATCEIPCGTPTRVNAGAKMHRFSGTKIHQ
jgi:hypothetical protein